jgi:hypothetical protein
MKKEICSYAAKRSFWRILKNRTQTRLPENLPTRQVAQNTQINADRKKQNYRVTFNTK